MEENLGRAVKYCASFYCLKTKPLFFEGRHTALMKERPSVSTRKLWPFISFVSRLKIRRINLRLLYRRWNLRNSKGS